MPRGGYEWARNLTPAQLRTYPRQALTHLESPPDGPFVAILDDPAGVARRKLQRHGAEAAVVPGQPPVTEVTLTLPWPCLLNDLYQPVLTRHGTARLVLSPAGRQYKRQAIQEAQRQRRGHVRAAVVGDAQAERGVCDEDV